MGKIPGFEGVYSEGETLEACRDELEEVLEEWIFFRISRSLPVPELEGLEFASQGRLMPPFGPVSRRDLIRHLLRIGFDGPFSGGTTSS